MEDRAQGEASYFSVPESRWRDVGPEGYRALVRARGLIEIALAELQRELALRGESVAPDTGSTMNVPAPAELALQLHEIASNLLSQIAPEEQNLREIITTLRTGLAVSWDLYSFRESEQVTVAEHIRNLRSRIEDFERELHALRRIKGQTNGSPHPPPDTPPAGPEPA